jgi:hypothetical protein
MDNLVTSCQHCNLTKHDKVGVWPTPLGYYDISEAPPQIRDTRPFDRALYKVLFLLAVFTATFPPLAIRTANDGAIPQVSVFLFWLVIAVIPFIAGMTVYLSHKAKTRWLN